MTSLNIQLFCLLIGSIQAWGNSENCKEKINIAAFNIKDLGPTKMGKPEICQILIRIIACYDIIHIQEIRNQETLDALMGKLNSKTGGAYEVVQSEGLGRDTHNRREIYAFLFRNKTFSVKTYDNAETNPYQYEDPDNKFFERPPFGAVFTSEQTDIAEFGVLGAHIKYDNVSKELEKLPDVYDDFKTKTGVEDVILMGDFNADCTYITITQLNELDLRDDPFKWLIDDDADTAVSKNKNCSYDRFVVVGDKMDGAIVENSAQVRVFEEEKAVKDLLDMGDYEPKHVSDHYPIVLELKKKEAPEK